MNEEERDIICLLEKTEDYFPGWYFSDEAQQLHGPFETREETVELYHKYRDQLG